jgi:glutaredoxin
MPPLQVYKARMERGRSTPWTEVWRMAWWPHTALPHAAAYQQLQRGEVRLFTAARCPHCKRAKADLAKRGVTNSEYDIDTPDGMAAFIQASGRAVPLLVTDSARVLGYSEGSYDKTLASARKQ